MVVSQSADDARAARHFRWSATSFVPRLGPTCAASRSSPQCALDRFVPYEELRISLLRLETDEARISERRSVRIPPMRAKATPGVTGVRNPSRPGYLQRGCDPPESGKRRCSLRKRDITSTARCWATALGWLS